MLLYRLAKRRYANDLSGEGSRLFGGRWNKKGVPVLYTSGSIALAILELIANNSSQNIAPDLALITISVPDSTRIKSISVSNLPGNWNSYPGLLSVAQLGSSWAESKETLVLQVPSSIVPLEHNFIINPQHSDFKHIEILSIVNWNLDSRL